MLSGLNINFQVGTINRRMSQKNRKDKRETLVGPLDSLVLGRDDIFSITKRNGNVNKGFFNEEEVEEDKKEDDNMSTVSLTGIKVFDTVFFIFFKI